MITDYTLTENLTAFLMSNCGSVFSVWSGKMSKKDQTNLLGHYFGKGLIVIDGNKETVKHYVRTAFGSDCTITDCMHFNGVLTVSGGYCVN
jgi:hypothetical protein